ncbi:hypothetical protein E2C01_074962 [Portunus trituberculatus]|uniref:Uncharacterized protein n=1 Tax=Portunus trituberculatus TaxID=210409 RepID=A0A5B7IIL6_PORTR|nr:hypothetical protein [Portunus trituberculatus]
MRPSTEGAKNTGPRNTHSILVAPLSWSKDVTLQKTLRPDRSCEALNRRGQRFQPQRKEEVKWKGPPT